jgi:hypothetical protein
MCEITALGDFQALWEEGEIGQAAPSGLPRFPSDRHFHRFFGAAANLLRARSPALVRDADYTAKWTVSGLPTTQELHSSAIVGCVAKLTFKKILDMPALPDGWSVVRVASDWFASRWYLLPTESRRNLIHRSTHQLGSHGRRPSPERTTSSTSRQSAAERCDLRVITATSHPVRLHHITKCLQ